MIFIRLSISMLMIYVRYNYFSMFCNYILVMNHYKLISLDVNAKMVRPPSTKLAQHSPSIGSTYSMYQLACYLRLIISER